MTIHVVTDSTSDLTERFLTERGLADAVHIVPLTVFFDEEEYKDGVDMSTAQFYNRLTASDAMPRTSQPSPADFVDAYRKISSPGDAILSLHLSGKLSGTYQSALLAARQLSDRTIEVVDTRSASLGLGLIVAEAVRCIRSNMDLKDVVHRIRLMMQRSTLYFLVDTLEYLQKNGRIGKAQALVGSLLQVKPLLTLKDGVVTPVDKARGKAKARQSLLDRLFSEVDPEKAVLGAVLHADAPQEATELFDVIQQRYAACKLYIAELGPTIGTHTGPGTLGVVLFEQ